jgi:histidyl-tRNA synthetase
MDESGAFSFGAFLTGEQAASVLEFLTASQAQDASGQSDRRRVLDRLRQVVAESPIGVEGVKELDEVDALLTAAGFGPDRVAFDPTVVRGLAYYTGPVFEATLTFEIADENGEKRQFGSVAGGGRYDSLVERFTGQLVPATGASIGVDRLLAALTFVKKLTTDRTGPVVVVTMDRERWAEYQKMVFELRRAGVAAELFLGKGGLGAQLKYADKRKAPLAVIAGGDEVAKNEVSLKDLRLGKQLSETITDRDAWRKAQPAQVSIPRASLVEEVKRRLAAS